MSDAIRDVTIRVRIEQIESQIKAPDFSAWKSGLAEIAAMQRDIGQQMAAVLVQPATFQQQAAGFQSIADAVKDLDVSTKAAASNADPFANIDASVQKMNSSLQQQAGTLNVVESAATKNFQSMINIAQAESVAERATRQATIAQRAMNVELITATGSALRSAAASGDYASAAAQLGQSLIYILRMLPQQTAGNAAVATSAASSATASGFQAVAIGAVGATGARAATANAALAASNVAAGTTAAAATPALAGMSLALGPIALIITGITVAVAVGKMAWDAYAEASRTAADDVRDAVKQRLDAERQSEQVEAAIDIERQKRRGWQLTLIDKQIAATERLKSVQDRAREAEQNSFQGRLELQDDDPNFQLNLLRGRKSSAQQSAAAMSAAKNADFNLRNTEGTDLLKGRENLLEQLQKAAAATDVDKRNQEQILSLKKQQLQVGIQDASNLRARLATIQDMISAEQGRLQSAAERFAQMDPGEQARLKEISQKVKGGGELSLQEAQSLSQSGLGQGVASQTFERIAKKAGFQDVAGNLGEFNQIQQLRFQGNGTKEALDIAEKLNTETRNGIEGIKSLLSDLVGNQQELLTAVEKNQQEVSDLKTRFENSKTKGRDSSPVGIYGNRVAGY